MLCLQSAPRRATGRTGCIGIWCSCLALLRGAFFADPIGLLCPLRFGEGVFAFHLPTLVAWPFIQVLLSQRIPVHRLLLPHIKQKVAVPAEGLLEKAPAETVGRSRSSAVCGSVSSQCTPLLGQHRSCRRSRPALLCFLARRRTCRRSRARLETGNESLSIVGWARPASKNHIPLCTLTGKTFS